MQSIYLCLCFEPFVCLSENSLHSYFPIILCHDWFSSHSSDMRLVNSDPVWNLSAHSFFVIHTVDKWGPESVSSRKSLIHAVKSWICVTVWRSRQPWCSVMVAIYFFTFGTSHRLSVQGNEVCSGAHQSVKVSRTAVLTCVCGESATRQFGLRSVSTLTCNLKPTLLRCYPPLPPPPPPSLPSSPSWCVRLFVALCASEHDPLGVSAATLWPQRWKLTNGRWLHQQPARQVEVAPSEPLSHQLFTLSLHQRGERWREGGRGMV